MSEKNLGEGRSGHLRATESERTHGTIRGHEVEFDEPRMEGKYGDEHPSPVDHLLASLGGCQVSVLDQCLQKSRVDEYEIEADISVTEMGEGEIPGEMPSNTAMRIKEFQVDIDVTVPEEYERQATRCLEVYDVGCIVGQSLRSGIEYTPETSLSIDDD